MVKSKYFLWMLASFAMSSCGQQSTSPQKKIEPAKDTSYIVSDSSIFKLQSKDPLVNLVNIYSDSINNAARLGVLPVFLEDAQLDYNMAAFSIMHAPEPIRKMIFDSVSNCESLRMILASHDLNYKIYPKKESGIHVRYLRFSMWDLASRRSKELKCK